MVGFTIWGANLILTARGVAQRLKIDGPRWCALKVPRFAKRKGMRAKSNCVLAAILLLPLHSAAQTVSTTIVESLKPTELYQLSTTPVGWYSSPEAAFAAHKAAREASQSYPWEYKVTNFRPCQDQVLYQWDKPTDWCWDDEVFYGGVSQQKGTTGKISMSMFCPSSHPTVVNLISGTGTVADPRRYKNRCEATIQRVLPNECPLGNPIFPSSGSKRERSVDYVSTGGILTFGQSYHSQFGAFNSSVAPQFVPPLQEIGVSCVAGQYRYWDQTIGDYRTRDACFEVLNLNASTRATYRGPDGVQDEVSWGGSGNGASVLPFQKSELSAITYDGEAAWLLLRKSENKLLIFSSSGRLLGEQRPDGRGMKIAYQGTEPIAVLDSFGRGLTLVGGATPTSVVDPEGQAIQYTYASGRLVKVTYQDGSSKTYVYDEPELVSGGTTWTNRLTGVIDENGGRYSSFGYSSGKSVSTQHAGGVDRFAIVDSRSGGAGNITATFPNGATYVSTYALSGGLSRVVASNQPAGSGCAASSSAITYDANGNVASRDDFNGVRSCYANDLSRNLETSRVEGLSSSASCGSVTAEGASLAAGSRKVSTQWHPDWRFEKKVAEPGRLTTKVYNGQPDPFAGGAVASCAPADALLPDGKPIVVLCKQVEQATTDANGSQGFNASLQSGVESRTTSWTYNRWGQVLSEDGPRTDIADVTSYSYYADTTAEHTLGDLQSVTNAAGQVSTYTKYNKHGQVLEESDANGVVTTRTYDLRQRLTSVTVAGQTTTYTYDPAGQLTRVTAPDQSHVAYEYDPAHRLVAVADSEGNRIEYTLDNAGNRTAEQVKDPNGALSRQLSRVFDALGRMQQSTGRSE